MRLLRSTILCQVLGLGLVVGGFFLPAIRVPPDAGSDDKSSSEVDGWFCAEVALIGTAEFVKSPKAYEFPIILSGWINPLLPLYLICCWVRRLRPVRHYLAAAIAACYIATWIFFAEKHAIPLIGHYLWIGGIALIIASGSLERRISSPMGGRSATA